MLTPKFKLTQDVDNLILLMHVPYIKYEEAECEISDNIFFFSAPPYYLRLHLPGEVLIDTGPSQYDIDSGDLTINLKKKNPGESFERLDMLTWLLTPKKTNPSPNIEVIYNSSESENNECKDDDKKSAHQEENLTISENSEEDTIDVCFSKSNDSNSDIHQNAATNTTVTENLDEASSNGISAQDVCFTEDGDIEWYIKQKIRDPEQCIDLENKTTGCGFALRRFNFNDISSEASYLIDIKDPNNISLSERRRLREEQENHKFDLEHYLADLFDDEMIKEAMLPTYPELVGTDGVSCTLNDTEMDKLTFLPKREYLIEPEILPQLYIGLVDLLFAFAYNYRFTFGEENVEADWIIGKLSSTLSWCDSFSCINDVVIACARRCLCFPLYRNWQLFEKVQGDVKQILKCGRTQILKCLLGILFAFQKSEDRYMLNDLYIVDYCVWIQGAAEEQIAKLACDLSNVKICKADVGFKLLEIETDARRLMEEESEEEVDIDSLAERMKASVIVHDASDCDSDDHSHSENDSSSSSDDTESESEES